MADRELLEVPFIQLSDAIPPTSSMMALLRTEDLAAEARHYHLPAKSSHYMVNHAELHGARNINPMADSSSTMHQPIQKLRHHLIIDRHISWEILRLFSGGLGMLVLVFVGYSAARQLGLAAEGQMEVPAALAVIGLKTLIVLEVLLPSALFFSVLAAIGRMHRDGEMQALYAAGVRPSRILQSVVKLSLVVALITAFVSITGRPWAYREAYRIEAEAVAKVDLKKIATGRFVTLENVNFTTLIADGLDLEHGLHKGVFLHRNYQGERMRSEIILAEAATLLPLNPGQGVAGRFVNGRFYSLDNRKQQDITVRFKELSITLPLEEARATYRRKAESTGNLAISRRPKDIAEFQWRTSTPVATLLLAMAAVPLARSKPRESRFRIFIVAIALYVAVFSMAALARTWVEQGAIGSVPGLWGVHLVLCLALLALLKQRV